MERGGMKELIIGLAGVLFGLFANELLRRRIRIESYSPIVFEKRLAVYEELYRRLRSAQQVVSEVIENTAATKEERHAMVSGAVLDIAGYCDEHELYLSEE